MVSLNLFAEDIKTIALILHNFVFCCKKTKHTHRLFNLNLQFPPLFLKSIWHPSSHPNAANEDSLWINEWDSSRKSDQTSVAVLQPIHLAIQTYCVRMLFELSSLKKITLAFKKVSTEIFLLLESFQRKSSYFLRAFKLSLLLNCFQ